MRCFAVDEIAGFVIKQVLWNSPIIDFFQKRAFFRIENDIIDPSICCNFIFFNCPFPRIFAIIHGQIKKYHIFSRKRFAQFFGIRHTSSARATPRCPQIDINDLANMLFQHVGESHLLTCEILYQHGIGLSSQ